MNNMQTRAMERVGETGEPVFERPEPVAGGKLGMIESHPNYIAGFKTGYAAGKKRVVMPAAPSDAVTDGTSFLIQICGEDIDHPLTAIVPNWEGVRRFCVEHYTGSEDAENLCGNILDTLKTEFDEHEAEETGKPYTEQWEIGGLSIERVCDCTPRVALSQTMQPQAEGESHAE